MGQTLTSEEIVSHATGKAITGKIKFQARSCDDILCDGETFKGPTSETDYYETSVGENLNVDANKYFQYKAYFETSNASYSPEMYNVSIEGRNFALDTAWIDWNGTNYTMQGSGLSWQKTMSNLAEGDYTYRVYANDTNDNSNVTEERTVTIKAYDISFSVVDSFTEAPISELESIDCSNGLSTGLVSKPFGPYDFFQGTYECNFTSEVYYEKTMTFTAYKDETIEVPMSFEQDMTKEEHYWLEMIYKCLYEGDCRASDFWEQLNQTTLNIWDQFKQTDESVITESIVTKDVNATSNLTIDYSIDVPTKENYEFLPIRIFYWFLDDNNETCYNQAHESDDAENPYCNPLVASTIGQVNTELNFTVELRPQLPVGEYNIVRRIDIDPPVNGQPVWINYGHEVIGKLTVLEDSNEMLVNLFKIGDSSLADVGTRENAEKEPVQKEADSTDSEEKSGLSKITGNAITPISSSVENKVVIGILCLVVFILGMQTSVLYKLSRKK